MKDPDALRLCASTIQFPLGDGESLTLKVRCLQFWPSDLGQMD